MVAPQPNADAVEIQVTEAAAALVQALGVWYEGLRDPKDTSTPTSCARACT
ncbi:hypothetical protein [Streptomyces jumonjinensis]|uniref:hypothetical protein n=1 Tax=Streptomyces jumonjinensis TaxID=1945 RepID=UPI0018867318|nr:hypothetical protein [Streptomyces jumonjinensis]